MDQSPGGEDAALQVVFHAMEGLANVLIDVAALGLYSLAGLVLLAVFATPGCPRWLDWLGAAEWGYRCICPGTGARADRPRWIERDGSSRPRIVGTGPRELVRIFLIKLIGRVPMG